MRAVVYDRSGRRTSCGWKRSSDPSPRTTKSSSGSTPRPSTERTPDFRSAEYFISRFVTGLLRPKRRILGSELTGEVEAVGAAVSHFEVGDHGPTSSDAHAPGLPPKPKLTPRQFETLRLLGDGLSTTEIATRLGVSNDTARNHVRAVLSALDAHSRLEAAVTAQHLGLLTPNE